MSEQQTSGAAAIVFALVLLNMFGWLLGLTTGTVFALTLAVLAIALTLHSVTYALDHREKGKGIRGIQLPETTRWFLQLAVGALIIGAFAIIFLVAHAVF